MAKEIQKLKKKIAKIYVDKIETFIDTFDKDGLQRFEENFDNIYDMVVVAIDDINCVIRLSEHLLNSRNVSPKELTLIKVFAYLLAAEGIICNYINHIVYILVLANHDLYSLTKRKYVKDDIEEIRKVEMSTKIQFLKHHGFAALTKEYDSTFRNDIAHHNYKIDEEGVLWVRGKSINLDPKVESLMKIIKFTHELVDEVIKTDVWKKATKILETAKN